MPGDDPVVGSRVTAGQVVMAAHYPVFDRAMRFARLGPRHELRESLPSGQPVASSVVGSARFSFAPAPSSLRITVESASNSSSAWIFAMRASPSDCGGISDFRPSAPLKALNATDTSLLANTAPRAPSL